MRQDVYKKRRYQFNQDRMYDDDKSVKSRFHSLADAIIGSALGVTRTTQIK
jgi:hypothetical protein